MKILVEMHEADLGLESSEKPERYQVRRATRAVVFDAQGNVALSHVDKGDYWKIPGGGVEEGESVEDALRRECREEAGVEIEIGEPIGIIIEWRDAWEQLQISYCYRVSVVGEKNTPEYDEGEQEKKFSSHWMSYDEALQKFGNVSEGIYEARFMSTRDGMFLKASKNRYYAN